jgi:hypothetical protein
MNFTGQDTKARRDYQGWQSGSHGKAPAQKCEAMSSNPSTGKRKKRMKKRKTLDRRDYHILKVVLRLDPECSVLVLSVLPSALCGLVGFQLRLGLFVL